MTREQERIIASQELDKVYDTLFILDERYGYDTENMDYLEKRAQCLRDISYWGEQVDRLQYESDAGYYNYRHNIGIAALLDEEA